MTHTAASMIAALALVLLAPRALAQDAAPSTSTPTSAPQATEVPAAVEAAPSSLGVLGIVGGGLAGFGAGTVVVATVVLVQEDKTTNHFARNLELVLGSASILGGAALIVVDALTE